MKQQLYRALLLLLVAFTTSSIAAGGGRNLRQKKTKKAKPFVMKNDDPGSIKAGLQFPVGRIGRYLLQGKYATRMGASAPVYLAAVLEYLCAEILKLAGNVTRESRKTLITAKRVHLVVTHDKELNKLLGGVTVNLDEIQEDSEAYTVNWRDAKLEEKVYTQTYSSYIYKVLKQIQPDTGISKKGMSIMNTLINDIFERIATEAGKLATYNKKATLTYREIQTAVRLLFPGNLSKGAVSEGTKAVTKFSSY